MLWSDAFAYDSVGWFLYTCIVHSLFETNWALSNAELLINNSVDFSLWSLAVNIIIDLHNIFVVLWLQSIVMSINNLRKFNVFILIFYSLWLCLGR